MDFVAHALVQDEGKKVLITNVVPTDFNYDGLMDVLISFKNPSDPLTYMWLCYGNGQILGMMHFRIVGYGEYEKLYLTKGSCLLAMIRRCPLF